jgi:acyl-CoA reductase-like NAD-dependent aldehyde dehydrogenase
MFIAQKIVAVLARTLQVGDPFDVNTKLGPVVSREHKKKIEKYIELARTNGHEVITVGNMTECVKSMNKGYYIMPTIIVNVDDQSALMTDEIFGPVTCLVPFDDENEVDERIIETTCSFMLLVVVTGYRTSQSHSIRTLCVHMDRESQSSTSCCSSNGSKHFT